MIFIVRNNQTGTQEPQKHNQMCYVFFFHRNILFMTCLGIKAPISSLHN